jgi:hypothetical protein
MKLEKLRAFSGEKNIDSFRRNKILADPYAIAFGNFVRALWRLISLPADHWIFGSEQESVKTPDFRGFDDRDAIG